MINYVPDDSTVKDKVGSLLFPLCNSEMVFEQMLYASTRNSLTKSLGAGHFKDSLYATSKADVSPEAYAAHLRHMNAPKPQTAQEREAELVREAERGGALEGSKGRRNHVGARVGLGWSEETEAAVTELGRSQKDSLLLLVRVTVFRVEAEFTSRIHVVN